MSWAKSLMMTLLTKTTARRSKMMIIKKTKILKILHARKFNLAAETQPLIKTLTTNLKIKTTKMRMLIKTRTSLTAMKKILTRMRSLMWQNVFSYELPKKF